MKTKVARREVELFVVSRIIRNMHLAVLAGNASVLVEHYSGVVVKSGSTTFEKAGNQNNSTFLGHIAKEFSGRTWYWFCQVEIICRFHLAEIQAIVQFLKHNEFRTINGSFLD